VSTTVEFTIIRNLIVFFESMTDLLTYHDTLKTAVSYLKTVKGMALQDILTEVYNYLELVDMPTNSRVYLLDKMADVE